MPRNVLDAYIRQKIEGDESSEVAFVWQGGEPTLLGLDFFKEALRLQNKYSDERTIVNAFQTNGVLLDERWCVFLSDANFLVGVSLDGPRSLHDIYRLDGEGHSSFDRVMRGIEGLARSKAVYNILTCIHNVNVQHLLKMYRFLREAGEYIQFIPVVERLCTDSGFLAAPDEAGKSKITPWSVDPDDYGRFLIVIFDEWIRRDVGHVYVNNFELALESWVGIEASVCLFLRRNSWLSERTRAINCPAFAGSVPIGLPVMASAQRIDS